MNRLEKLIFTNRRKRLENYEPVPEVGCWIYAGAWDVKGYGKFKIGSKTNGKAHRFFYESLVGSIPDGMVVRHKCDTPACVNPAHLCVGTPADNDQDRIERGRSSRGHAHSEAIKRGLAKAVQP